MLIRPEAHDGEKEIPVRTMKTGLVSILAMGLLAGSPAGVAAQEGADAGEAPTEFTGHVACRSNIQRGTTKREASPIDGSTAFVRHLTRGAVFRAAVEEISDPRLEGTLHVSFDSYELWYPERGEDAVTVGHATWRIENEDGAWEGSYPTVSLTPFDSMLLVGEGAYEGLVAAWTSQYDEDCSWDVRGVIFGGTGIAAPAGYPPAG